jgi:threonine/homoserine/homoserine lactone efflux protein
LDALKGGEDGDGCGFSTMSPSERVMLVTDDFAVFLGVSTLVIATPGQDTALTVRNTLSGGRRAGLFTALGVCAGQATWAVATSTGIGALIVASELAFVTLRLLGSLYLLFLGARAILEALRSRPAKELPSVSDPCLRLTSRVALRQGLFSNLVNPKMAAFFTSLLPQFATSFSGLLALGLVFCSMTLMWLSGYTFAIAKAAGFLRRPRVMQTVEALTGTVLIALGARLATEGR